MVKLANLSLSVPVCKRHFSQRVSTSLATAKKTWAPRQNQRQAMCQQHDIRLPDVQQIRWWPILKAKFLPLALVPYSFQIGATQQSPGVGGSTLAAPHAALGRERSLKLLCLSRHEDSSGFITLTLLSKLSWDWSWYREYKLCSPFCSGIARPTTWAALAIAHWLFSLHGHMLAHCRQLRVSTCWNKQPLRSRAHMQWTRACTCLPLILERNLKLPGGSLTTVNPPPPPPRYVPEQNNQKMV